MYEKMNVCRLTAGFSGRERWARRQRAFWDWWNDWISRNAWTSGMSGLYNILYTS